MPRALVIVKTQYLINCHTYLTTTRTCVVVWQVWVYTKMPTPDSLELIHCACLRRFGSDSVNAKRFHRYLLDFQQALYRECGMRATSVRALMRVLEKLTSRMLCVHLFN